MLVDFQVSSAQIKEIEKITCIKINNSADLYDAIAKILVTVKQLHDDLIK